jgi:predicted PurR-regulated permease PerM
MAAPEKPIEQPVPRFFLVLMVLATVAVVMVFTPLARELFLAAVLAGVLWPVREWLSKRLGGRPGLATGLLVVAVILLLVGPLAVSITMIIRDGDEGVRFVHQAAHSERVLDIIGRLPDAVANFIYDGIDRLPASLEEVPGMVGTRGRQAAAAMGAAVGSLTIHSAMMIIALWFLLRRGDQLVHWIDEVSPLRRGQTRELLTMFKRVSYAVVVSAVATAAVQAAAALIGYLIARVPNPLFFTIITFLVAFIPAVGAASVCIVAAVLVFATGHPYLAIFLAAWGIIVVGLVDNIIKPLLVRRGMEIHGGVVFFGLIGGVSAFGPIGLLVGPLVIALFMSLLRMYHRDFSPRTERQPEVPGIPGDAPFPDADSM